MNVTRREALQINWCNRKWGRIGFPGKRPSRPITRKPSKRAIKFKLSSWGGRNLWERSWWGEWAFGQLQHKKGRRPPLSSSQSLLETTLEEKAFPFPGYIAVVNMGCALAAPLIKVLISSFLSPLLLFTSMKMSTGVFRFPNKQQYNNFRVKDIGRYVDLSSITFLTTQLPPASPTLYLKTYL